MSISWRPNIIAATILTSLCALYAKVLISHVYVEKQTLFNNKNTKENQIDERSFSTLITTNLSLMNSKKEISTQHIHSNMNKANTKLEETNKQLTNATNQNTQRHQAISNSIQRHIYKAEEKKEHKFDVISPQKNSSIDKPKLLSAHNQKNNSQHTPTQLPLKKIEDSQSKKSELLVEKNNKENRIKNVQESNNLKKDLLSEYMAYVRLFIASHKHYPREAKIRKQKGKVTVSFIIDAQGRVRNAKIVKSCRSRYLNKSTKILLAKLKFKAVPNKISKMFPKKVTLEVNYQMG